MISALDAPHLAEAVRSMKTTWGIDTEMPPAPDRLLEEGDTVEVGDACLQVLSTPGHTPGGIVLFAATSDANIAFVGDTLFPGGHGRVDLPGGDEGLIMRSLARIGTLCPQIPCAMWAITAPRLSLANLIRTPSWPTRFVTSINPFVSKNIEAFVLLMKESMTDGVSRLWRMVCFAMSFRHFELGVRMLVNASDMLKNAGGRPLRFGRLQHQQPGMDARYSPGCRGGQVSLIMQCTGGAASGWAATRFVPTWSKLALRLSTLRFLLLCTSIMVPARIASRPWMQALRPLCTTVLTRPTSRPISTAPWELVDLAHSRSVH